MIEFKVSAPGKVILFGEHSVVYGKSAIAGSINLRTTLTFSELTSDKTFIHLSLPETKIDKNIEIKTIENYFFTGENQINHQDPKFIPHVEKFVETIDYESNSQKLCLQAIFFLLIKVCQAKNNLKITPLKIHVETELTIGSGLGSSASFAVCVSACFLNYAKIKLSSNKKTELNEEFLKEINDFAFDCEKLMHGTPSGLDNSICTYGSLLYFKKGEQFVRFPCTKVFRILLVDTKVSRSTKILVQKVRNLKDEKPKVFEEIMESLDDVAKRAFETIKRIIESNDGTSIDEGYSNLEMYVKDCQNLLRALGVSHPALDTICMEAKNHEFAAKLTGAGGGGYAYVLISHKTTEDKIQALMKKLSEHGFGVKLTQIGGPGVEIN